MAVCDKAEQLGCICVTCTNRYNSEHRLCCLAHPDHLCVGALARMGLDTSRTRTACKRYREEKLDYATD